MCCGAGARQGRLDHSVTTSVTLQHQLSVVPDISADQCDDTTDLTDASFQPANLLTDVQDQNNYLITHHQSEIVQGIIKLKISS